MQSKYSNPTVSSSNPSTQPSALSGFKFASIGHNPSLLERMSDGLRVSFPLRPSDPNSSQEQNGPSHTPFRPNQSQPTAMVPPPVERGSSVKPVLSQDRNSFPLTSTSLSPSEPPNDVKAPQPLDQIRVLVFPELQYPKQTPEIKSPHWQSPTAHPQPHLQPVPMDQDTSHQPQPPVPRTLPAPASSAPVGPGFASEPTDSSTLSSHTTSSQHGSSVTSSTEPEQLRRSVELLFKISSAREEGLSKRRETFDLRSGELSTFGMDASRAIQDLQDRTETLKQHAEEMRTQAELTLREANKMRDMADRLIVSAGTLGVEMLGAKNHVGRTVERSEQLSRYVRKSFDWLATLRPREQEKIVVIQAEIEEQERAELLRRQQELQQQLERRKIEEQELQQQLERRKIEEQEKLEAAKREEEAREAARKKAEEEREEAARKIEEEREAARKKSYEIRRAEVMAEKRRATEAQAQSIQAERERRVADTSSSSSRPSVRGSNAPLSTSPAPSPEVARSASASTDVPFQRATVPTPSREPIARTGESSETTPPFSSPQALPNKGKTMPAHVSFVPAQTEAGRAVNTDSPLSSTTLASELHPRNVVEAPPHPHSSQIMHDPAEEEIQFQRPSQAALTLEPRQVEIKREPSVGELPPRPQPLDAVNTDHSQGHQPVAVPRSPSQDRNVDQQALPSSTYDSRATSLHAQTEDHRYRMGVSTRDDLYHTEDSLHDHVVPSMDGRAYARQHSVSSDRSVPPWRSRDRRSRSPLSSRDDRLGTPSRSPPYRRKRTRSRTPPRFVDHWEPDRPRIRPRFDDDWDRPSRYNGYERVRQGDSPQCYRPPPRRAYNCYRPSPSPSPSPRQFRNERSPPRRAYYDRSPAAEHVSQRYVDMDTRADDHSTNVNARHPEPAYEEAEVYRTAEKEQQQRWPQHQWQRRSSSPSERDQPSTSSPTHGEVEIGLLDRMNMNETEDRRRGRGRPPPGAARGGPSTRRGTRGGSSGGRGRGSAPALLWRMSETTTRPTRPAPILSLSDRMGQD